MEKIKQLALVGGTHGNELTGVQLLKWYQKHPEEIQRSTFSTTTLIANPYAVEACRRYIEKDLNRCFTEAQLRSENSSTLEEARAKEIEQLLGARASSFRQDLIVDIHNSTAHMGYSLIFGQLDEFTKKLCAHLSQKEPNVRLYYMPEPDLSSSPYLPSLAKRDLCLEIGPQAHGTLIGELYEGARRLITALLDFTEHWNQKDEAPTLFPVTIYEHYKNIDFPRNAQGELNGYIHPKRQGKDYEPVRKGDPLFRLFDGRDVLWEDEQTVYPVFINENAYYEKGMAMSLTLKKDELF